MKRWRKWLLTVACIILVVALAFFIAFSMSSSNRLEHALGSYTKPEVIQRYEARVDQQQKPDEITDAAFPDSSPATQSSQEEKNYAAYAQLFQQLEAAWEDVGEKRFPLYQRISEDDWAYLEALALKHPALIQAIREAAQRGAPIAKIDFSTYTFSNQSLPHYETLPKCILLLMADLRNQMAAGEAAVAYADIDAGIRLTSALAEEHLEVSFYFSQEMFSFITRTYQEHMPAGSLSIEEGTQLIQLLDQARQREACSAAMEMNQYLVLDAMNDLETLPTREFMQRYAAGDREELGTNIACWFVGSAAMRPLMDHNLSMILENQHYFDGINQTPLHEMLQRTAPLEARLLHTLPTNAIARYVLSDNLIMLSAQARHEVQLDLMRLGIAVELYHTQYGVYPDTLDAVAPLLGTTLPADPYNGLPFRYEPLSDAFLLSNLGADGIISSNTQSWTNNDIVWRGDKKKKTNAQKSIKVAGGIPKGVAP